MLPTQAFKEVILKTDIKDPKVKTRKPQTRKLLAMETPSPETPRSQLLCRTEHQASRRSHFPCASSQALQLPSRLPVNITLGLRAYT